jgi:hypothetical protein
MYQKNGNEGEEYMERMKRYIGEECIRTREKKGGIYRKDGWGNGGIIEWNGRNVRNVSKGGARKVMNVCKGNVRNVLKGRMKKVGNV